MPHNYNLYSRIDMPSLLALHNLAESTSDKDVFTMVIAHEFFDALPINVFQVSGLVCRSCESRLISRDGRRTSRTPRKGGERSM